MHGLRRFYAGVLRDAGEPGRALAEDLGHADPGCTLHVHKADAGVRRSTEAAADEAL